MRFGIRKLKTTKITHIFLPVGNSSADRSLPRGERVTSCLLVESPISTTSIDVLRMQSRVIARDIRDTCKIGCADKGYSLMLVERTQMIAGRILIQVIHVAFGQYVHLVFSVFITFIDLG